MFEKYFQFRKWQKHKLETFFVCSVTGYTYFGITFWTIYIAKIHGKFWSKLEEKNHCHSWQFWKICKFLSFTQVFNKMDLSIISKSQTSTSLFQLHLRIQLCDLAIVRHKNQRWSESKLLNSESENVIRDIRYVNWD